MRDNRMSFLKSKFFRISILLIFVQIFAQKTPQKETMFVNGRFLYTSANEKVVLRGVNEMFVWSGDKTGQQILPEIAKTGANTVRLVWTTEGSLEEYDALIQNCIKNNMIPMVEIHDATGDFSKFDIVLNYWLQPEVKEMINKHQKWVLLNIANEVGDGNVSDSVFIAKYSNAISKLREAGYKMPLIIDAPDWGKDEKMISRTWQRILAQDRLKNTMFSVHTYWVDKNAEARLDNFIAEVVKQNIPFLFGEGPEPYGWDCSTSFPYLHCMKLAQVNEIGWLTWSWGAVKNGDCKNKGAFDMTSDGQFGSWNSDWGRLISVDDAHSIQKTSIRPKSILK